MEPIDEIKHFKHIKELPNSLERRKQINKLKSQVQDVFRIYSDKPEFIGWLSSRKGFGKLIYVLDKSSTIDHPFAFERVQELFLKFKKGQEEHKRYDKLFEIKKYRKVDNSGLKLQKEFFYRNIPRKYYKIWKTLLKKGLQVEPIEKVYFSKDKIPKKLYDYFDFEKKDDVFVVSKHVGQTFADIKNIINPVVASSIIKQIILTITEVWKLGFVHSHPHSRNWTISIENNFPKVYLIDFNMAKELPKGKKNIYLREASLGEDLEEIKYILKTFLDKKYISKRYYDKLFLYLHKVFFKVVAE